MSIKILTNHRGRGFSRKWDDSSRLLEPPLKKILLKPFFRKAAVLGRFLFSLSHIALGIRMFLGRRHYDVIVIGGGSSDYVFSFLQTLIMPFKKPTPTIKLDCLWYRGQNRFRHDMKSLQLRFASLSIDVLAVWASREKERYAEAFRIPRDKFRFIPYHTTNERASIEPVRGNYIFSGGNFARDYNTLIEAVDGLPVQVFIACSRKEAYPQGKIPENVTIAGVSPEEFISLLAKSLFVVVPLRKGLLHYGGQQTYLNAMKYGKPVIVTDPEGASDYIIDGVSGMLVEPGDPGRLRKTIEQLLNNSTETCKMGQAAKEAAKSFTTEKHFDIIHDLATQICVGKGETSCARLSGPGRT